MMGELEKGTGRRIDLVEDGCLLPFETIVTDNQEIKPIIEQLIQQEKLEQK